MADFAFLSIPELGRLLRTKRTSATELAGYFLDRLERIGPRFNAVVTVTAAYDKKHTITHEAKVTFTVAK